MTGRAELLDDERLAAGVDMVHRTGAMSVQLRYSDDEQPGVWMAIAQYSAGAWQVAAGLDPLQATMRLCEELIDGGTCAKCGRPSGFEPDAITPMPHDRAICWYQYDPGAKRFVQGCAA